MRDGYVGYTGDTYDLDDVLEEVGFALKQAGRVLEEKGGRASSVTVKASEVPGITVNLYVNTGWIYPPDK